MNTETDKNPAEAPSALTDVLAALREILKSYADRSSYWTETRDLAYISNGHTSESFSCTDVDSSDAERGLILLDTLEQKIYAANADVTGLAPEGDKS